MVKTAIAAWRVRRMKFREVAQGIRQNESGDNRKGPRNAEEVRCEVGGLWAQASVGLYQGPTVERVFQSAD